VISATIRRDLAIPSPQNGMSQTHNFYDEDALLERLLNGLKKRRQEVVFVVGSALSSPVAQGAAGVPGVDGVIDLIRHEFEDDASQLAKFNDVVHATGASRYQEAFVFLQGRRGPQTANEIVRAAVLGAWTSTSPNIGGYNQTNSEELLRAMELDLQNWALGPGTQALGRLIAGYPDRFGRSLLTTNFDPLLEVAIRQAGGQYLKTSLHSDGNPAATEGTGCHIIHLHGYWYGSDTLHTGRQINQECPRLKAWLGALLRNKLVVVSAYGGWDDAFTEALMDVVRDDAAYPEILWTFYSGNPAEALLQRLAPGVDRGRIMLYADIDCNSFLPKLFDAWSTLESPAPLVSYSRSNPVHVSETTAQQILLKPREKVVVEGDDEDRPPVIDLCVGRERELQEIKNSPAKILFVTGFGGQGKSTLAAKYFADSQHTSIYSYLVWRDCKEESERFEIQLASVIEKLSEGRLSGKDLAQQSAESIVGLLMGLIKDLAVLFVFDNADHYVDLEERRMIGSAEMFVEALQQSPSHSRVVFTCRPSVQYRAESVLSIGLEGIKLDAAQDLFLKRGATSVQEEIRAAHTLTNGHVFWLDLLAIQVAQRTPNRTLSSLLAEIRSGGGPLPANTLNSIWSTLRDREQSVLRAMAETVKPVAEGEIADYLGDRFHYNKVAKALRALKSLNLVVIKRPPSGPDVLELHPLVRQFIRQRFAKSEQASYINGIIGAYKRIMGRHRSHLGERPSLSLLQYWTQNAELDIAVGNLEDAFDTLGEVLVAFMTSAYPRELARVVRLLFASVDWISEHERFRLFELVFRSHTQILSYLGEVGEVDRLLDQYERTVPSRNARYINYCELRAFSLWVRNDFGGALEWATIGQKLVQSSDVDTRSRALIADTLALAQRDAGQPEMALPYFLGGRPLGEVVDPEELDEQRGEPHYGNVGRCLHFMGQIDSALVCYQKSALIIERSPVGKPVMNQACIRTWIGELLIGRGEYGVASMFLKAAVRRWEHVAPPKAEGVSSLLRQIDGRSGATAATFERAEKICLDWILGRDIDVSRSGLRR
jgi:plasmid stabilization system protein ParE/tetratricopeptide (TPR) repeat protein